jgi:hypothetical protein
MAILNSAIYTAQTQAGTKGFGGRASAANVSAVLLWATFTYTATGSETSGDTINFGRLTEGSVVIPALCRLSTDGLAGTSTAITKIGDGGSDNRYSATSVAVVSAGSTALTASNGQMVTPVGVPDGYETITGVITHSGAPTAGKKLVLNVAYYSVV